MPIQLDHMILPVADLDRSIEFFTKILGCTYEGEREPFSVIRVTPDLTLQLAPWGTDGGVHLAFALPRAGVRRRVRPREGGRHSLRRLVPCGRQHAGPGEEPGSRGDGKAVYFFDPNQHLIEIRHYEG